MSTVTFNLDNLTGADAVPLFCQYPREYRPQPAHVEMDQHGEVSAGYNPDPGRYSTTSDRAHGRTLAWSIEPHAKPGRLADLLREHAELFQRVHDGHILAWDGRNHIGYLSDEAQAASDDLERILRDFGADPDNLVAVWTADEWLFTSNSLRDIWSGRPLAEALADLEDEARRLADDNHITGDMEGALLDRALHEFDAEGDDCLDPHHVAALLAAGRIPAEAASAWAEARQPD